MQKETQIWAQGVIITATVIIISDSTRHDLEVYAHRHLADARSDPVLSMDLWIIRSPKSAGTLEENNAKVIRQHHDRRSDGQGRI